MELTKEQYEKIATSDDAFKLGLIPDWAYYGYGIRTFKTWEENGKYFMSYTTWDNCD